jgi:hypothetical protein
LENSNMRNEKTRIKKVIIETQKSDKPVATERITGNPKTNDRLTIK